MLAGEKDAAERTAEQRRIDWIELRTKDGIAAARERIRLPAENSCEAWRFGRPPQPAQVAHHPGNAFRLDQRVKNQIAVFEETRKLLASTADTLQEGACDAAYDLARDPLETTNLATDERWPAELARKTAATVHSLLTARTERLELELDPETREQLDALGYGGDDDAR